MSQIDMFRNALSFRDEQAAAVDGAKRRDAEIAYYVGIGYLHVGDDVNGHVYARGKSAVSISDMGKITLLPSMTRSGAGKRSGPAILANKEGMQVFLSPSTLSGARHLRGYRKNPLRGVE